ncbi:hypothetical protein ACFL14_00835 [Patescibacteria group bacterium]
MFFTLKIWRKNGKVDVYPKLKNKNKIFRLVQDGDFEKAYIKVMYDRVFYNDGEYENKKDLVEVFRVFMEKELIDYFADEKPEEHSTN